jgi:bacillithiol system protein YtxJ
VIRRFRDVLTDRPVEPNAPSAELLPIPDGSTLDQIFDASYAAPVVLFLNDPYCPVSARAYRRISQVDGTVHLIDVSRQHELNRTVATRTGVRHESPQAFVLHNGAAVWNASHGDITSEQIVAARANATPG